jgi:uncharacterized protein
MIKISVANLDLEGNEFRGFEPHEFIDFIESPLISATDKVVYKLHAKAVSGGILVTGEVSTKVKATCGRCLEEFELELANRDICRFYEKVSESEIEISEDIREDLLINLPTNLLCREDCQGLCPKCGCNLNEDSCDCHQENIGSDIWSELDKLK